MSPFSSGQLAVLDQLRKGWGGKAAAEKRRGGKFSVKVEEGSGVH